METAVIVLSVLLGLALIALAVVGKWLYDFFVGLSRMWG